MQLKVSNPAIQWFEESVGIPSDAKNPGIRFRSKIYGDSPVSKSFALAIEISEPRDPLVTFTADSGLLFYIEKSDEWFFNQHDLLVDYDEDLDEPKYIYLKDGQAINQ